MKNNTAFVAVAMLLLFSACQHKQKADETKQGWKNDTARFSVDESFEPVMEQEAFIFGALNKKAHLVIGYKSENEAIQSLLDDSVRMIMTSRKLDTNEVKVLQGRRLVVHTYRFAIDAAVLIVNKTSNDTLISVGEIKKMLTGDMKTAKNIVFDNAGSGLLRYFKDLAGVNAFKPKNIFALHNNKEVINYVSTHPDAIGITSLNWLYDPDNDYADAVKNVKIVAVKDENSKKYPVQYIAPSQTTLYLKQYPLTRDLFIVNCSGKTGLETWFSTFITGDKGQRIVQQSGLLPDQLPEREISIKRSFN